MGAGAAVVCAAQLALDSMRVAPTTASTFCEQKCSLLFQMITILLKCKKLTRIMTLLLGILHQYQQFFSLSQNLD